ncbi:MAG: hypothetical protein H0W94_07250, partial [Actinobacteria bacterium]|nr:hypothetical protein [Actinomycetota bacterium]
PYHNCCTQGNVDAATPLLLLSSRNEVVDRQEPDAMFDLVAATTIPVSKVILDNAGHAFYADWIIDYDRPTNPDRLSTSDDPLLPNLDGLTVERATADYFLAQLT